MSPLIEALAAPAVRTTALTLTALVATALPAVAAQTLHDDATGDVVLLGIEDDNVTPQPSWRQGDIKKIRATHGAHRVRVRLTMREVRRRTSNSFFVRVRTATRRFEVAGFTAEELPRGVWFLISPNGQPRRCPRLEHHVNYGSEAVRISVPRRCLGGPARIRVGAGAQTSIDAAEQTRLDDAYSSGQVDHITFGPWMRRG